MRTWLRFWLIISLLSLPTALAVGWGYINGGTLLFFLALTLIVPFALLSIRTMRERLDIVLHRGTLLYMWVTTTFLAGSGILTIPYAPGEAGFWWLHVLVLFLYQGFFLGGSFLLDYWQRTTKLYWWGRLLTMSFYAFPLPVVIMGSVLYPPIDPNFAMFYFASIIGIVKMAVLLLIVMTMATIVFTFFPRRGESHRWWRIGKIVIIAACWLLVNSAVLYGNLGETFGNLAAAALPMFQGSLLIFVTPFLFEIGTLAAAVGIGTGIERLVVRGE